MMGAGGFIRNPGWEILSSDDLMDEDYDYGNGILIENPFDDDEVDLNSQFVLFVAPPDEESDENDDFDDIDNDEDDEDDEDYVPDSLDDEDFDDDNAIVMSSDDSAPELSN
ncbi:putative uncharacterized protein DDB_G0270496 isoform X1 [Zophobas morio]|uniref:putative uncharacterized protein DDB_G0270496 isoform X1 n=1 Tax=Zophobas morio TaxID=2755281 RepID=UPI003082EFD3